ncbi:MAG: glycosyltransferase [Thiobacillaceae bacterium]|jgi:GT2 family glycosyltransferase|nr:glycosyltransferase [Thiobacillaceae bacterium]
MIDAISDPPETDAPPLISVIMPCYNAAPYVTEAVESALGQSHGNVELIVVDDGSSDGSDAILARLAEAHAGRLHLLFTSRAGPYPARNVGLKQARGEYIAFLDADDWWLPDTLEKLHAALREHDADLAYCGWQNVGEGITSLPHVPPPYEEEDVVDHFVRTCPWPIHAALVKRSVVERLGGFSERRYASMDYDFWLRALAVTRRIKRVPEVLAFYRWHNLGQVSAVKWRQVLDALDAQQNFIRDNPRLVAHLSAERLRDLTEGQVLRQAYRAFWKRDLVSAQKLFRHAAAKGSYRLSDLRHVLSAFLPLPLYRGLVMYSDRRRA